MPELRRGEVLGCCSSGTTTVTENHLPTAGDTPVSGSPGWVSFGKARGSVSDCEVEDPPD